MAERLNSLSRRAIRLMREQRISVLEACRRVGAHPQRVYTVLRNDRKRQAKATATR